MYLNLRMNLKVSEQINLRGRNIDEDDGVICFKKQMKKFEIKIDKNL